MKENAKIARLSKVMGRMLCPADRSLATGHSRKKWKCETTNRSLAHLADALVQTVTHTGTNLMLI
jgi:hypothetical protein